jgi:hypothetical protein
MDMEKAGKIFAFGLLAIFMVSFMAGVVAAQDVQIEVQEFFERVPVRYIIGIVFGLWEPNKVTELYAKGNMAISKVGAIIAYLALWMILLFAFGNIISIFLPLDAWVGWVIGVALTIAAAQMNFVFYGISVLAYGTASLGVASVFLSILMAFIAFFLLSIGTERLRIWATHRKLAMEQIKSMKGTARVTRGLKDVGKIAEALEKTGE